MQIDVNISINKELLENGMEFNSTNVANGWVEIEGAIKFPVQVLKTKENKMFVKFPTKRNGDDSFSNVVFPVDKDVRKNIEEKVMSEVHNQINKSFNHPEITKVNVTLLPDAEPGRSVIVRGYADVEICGIKIHGFAIKENEKGFFVQMPQYRDSHGQYQDTFYATNKVMRIDLINSILEEYENSLKRVEQEKILEEQKVSAVPEKRSELNEQAPKM